MKNQICASVYLTAAPQPLTSELYALRLVLVGLPSAGVITAHYRCDEIENYTLPLYTELEVSAHFSLDDHSQLIWLIEHLIKPKTRIQNPYPFFLHLPYITTISEDTYFNESLDHVHFE